MVGIELFVGIIGIRLDQLFDTEQLHGGSGFITDKDREVLYAGVIGFHGFALVGCHFIYIIIDVICFDRTRVAFQEVELTAG